MRGCFVTGTDTGVGKSVLTAAIVAWLRSRDEPVRALKPVITGLAEEPDPVWRYDHELLARMAGAAAEETMLVGYGPPVSPHLAAALAQRPLELEALVQAITVAVAPEEALVVEGVGGLLVPLSEAADVRDLARALGLPIVVAARPGLGTINHTLLTLEAARAGGLEVAGVVLTPWPSAPSEMERSNRDTIAERGGVEVATLKLVSDAQPPALAAAADALPLERWLR
ncbi:MAG: dethiobiotin synthetase [Solirubrobacteraceae bacterium]|jgi:dethiobiotin synthetase|nr:dethiobiotin synthetase [Solirubrobacteraceae bacterium]